MEPCEDATHDSRLRSELRKLRTQSEVTDNQERIRLCSEKTKKALKARLFSRFFVLTI
jgi:hypothetical protein